MTGGIAPFSITSAGSARAHAAAILTMTQLAVMPPWPPGPDSPPYIGSERRILTPAERKTIARWVQGGAEIGMGGTIDPVRSRSLAPGTDLSLEPAQQYSPHAAGGGLDDYHCFLLEPHLKQDVFVTSAQIKPGEADLVHHVILFEAAGSNADEARSLNKASGGKGWTCFGGPGLDDAHPDVSAASSDRLGAPQWISAWVPGRTATDLPRGTGVLLHAGAAVVMQVHYNLIHPAHPDKSRAVLRVLPAKRSGLTPLDTMLVPAPVELPCPRGIHSPACSRDRAIADETRKYGRDAALIPYGLLFLCGKTLADYPQNVGEGDKLRTSCNKAVTRPLRIYGVAGHMHLRGVDIKIELEPRHEPRQDAPAHPALALPLAGRLLLADADRRRAGRHDPCHLPLRQLPRRSADPAGKTTPSPVRRLGGRHDRRNVPRAPAGIDAQPLITQPPRQCLGREARRSMGSWQESRRSMHEGCPNNVTNR